MISVCCFRDPSHNPDFRHAINLRKNSVMETVTSVHIYNVNMKWDPETGTGLGRSGNRMPLVFGPPPEFGGTEATWSPEHLLAAAVSSCYTNTFLHFARLLK